MSALLLHFFGRQKSRDGSWFSFSDGFYKINAQRLNFAFAARRRLLRASTSIGFESAARFLFFRRAWTDSWERGLTTANSACLGRDGVAAYLAGLFALACPHRIGAFCSFFDFLVM